MQCIDSLKLKALFFYAGETCIVKIWEDVIFINKY